MANKTVSIELDEYTYKGLQAMALRLQDPDLRDSRGVVTIEQLLARLVIRDRQRTKAKANIHIAKAGVNHA